MLKRLPPCLGSMLSTIVTRAPSLTSSIARLLPIKPNPPVIRTSLFLNSSILPLQLPKSCVLHKDVIHRRHNNDEAWYAIKEATFENVVREKPVWWSHNHI